MLPVCALCAEPACKSACSLCLLARLFVYLCICLPACLSNLPGNMSVCVAVCLLLSDWVPLYLCVCRPVCQFVGMAVYMSVCTHSLPAQTLYL